MDLIALAAVPNQEISVRLSRQRFVLRIKEAAGVMVVDVTVDGEVRLLASRIVAGTPLIPYRYLEAGNLLLLTEGEQLPDYRQFGVTQSLVYLSADEIAAL